jgi:hypothetical protein
MTAGRLDQSHAVLHEAREAVESSGDSCGRFVLELAESGLNYADGRFAPALELVQRAQRSGGKLRIDSRVDLARIAAGHAAEG